MNDLQRLAKLDRQFRRRVQAYDGVVGAISASASVAITLFLLERAKHAS